VNLKAFYEKTIMTFKIRGDQNVTKQNKYFSNSLPAARWLWG
jgi:hypothetical protein